ncbi:palmitoyltransferase ZDHHC22-like [Anneissia japonica]|uniref:palmitoyltransferase ZDHHC22-like n=1 Tax=Anneissia japonica TaxID=1529436 RepID=UPI001425A035|nr:palmitoyltransferase ZDHHC22-like [Anneissia japonica]
MTDKKTLKLFHIMNIAATIYCILMQIIVGSVTYFVCIPAIYHNEVNTQLWHRVGFILILLGLVVNYLLCLLKESTLDRNQVLTKTSSRGEETTMLPMYTSDSMKEWTYCSLCRLDSPPRCHHCPICNVCVLKRISHCFFVGKCIGHYNHRYYVSFLIYTILVAFYSLLLYLSYLHDHFGTPLSRDILGHLYPIAVGRFILGKVPLYALLLLTLMYQCLMYTVGCGFLLYQALNNIKNGQTPHEAHNKSSMYNYGIKENMQVVFGRRWFLAVIIPWPSKLPGDGMQWELSNRAKVF